MLFTIPAIITCAIGTFIGAWTVTVLNEFVIAAWGILIPMILGMMEFMVVAVVAVHP